MLSGRSLIKFIKTWQNVLRRKYPNNDVIKFEFNTYIISVLVIFFFQVKYHIPIVENIWTIPPTIASKHVIDIELVREFFLFYGNEYKIYNQIISVQSGKWQERFVTLGQTLSTTQQRFVLINTNGYNYCNSVYFSLQYSGCD